MRKLFQVAAWLLVLAIVVLSLGPPSLRPVTAAPHDVEHIAIFLLAGLCMTVGYPYRYVFQAIAFIIFAGSIEIAQLWVPGRHARWSDFIVDGLAAVAGVGFAWLYERLSSGTPFQLNADK